MKRHLPMILAVGGALIMIAVTAVVQGRWTERWQPRTSAEMEQFAAGIRAIPMSIGDWDGEDNPSATQRELEAAGAVGYLSRAYRNPATGKVVSIYLICGASRSVAVHTPESCYPGAGFRMEGSPEKFVLPYGTRTNPADKSATAGPSAEFTTAVFFKETPEGTQRLRLFWAWDAYGVWEAPDWPRVRFGGRTALNKLYLICPEPKPEAPAGSPALEFAKIFLPIVDRQLFPSGKTPSSKQPTP